MRTVWPYAFVIRLEGACGVSWEDEFDLIETIDLVYTIIHTHAHSHIHTVR